MRAFFNLASVVLPAAIAAPAFAGDGTYDAGEPFAMLLGMAVMATVPAYFVLQWKLAVALKGRWRRAALLPLALSIPLVLYSLYALGEGSNLWPLLFILFAPFGFGYLGVIWWLSRR